MSFLDPNTSESKIYLPDSILEDQPSKEPIDSSINSKTPEESDQSTKPIVENGNEDRGEEEEGECGFCLFMKAGGCRESFVAWENCIQEAENNSEEIVEKCYEVTKALTKCMAAHADYYGPLLQAEKATKEEAVKDLEREKAVKESESNVAEKETPVAVHSKDSDLKGSSCGQ